MMMMMIAFKIRRMKNVFDSPYFTWNEECRYQNC